MERSDCDVEEGESHRSSEADGVVVQKNMESPIKINSIYVDLTAPRENSSTTAERCHHFSIRGYVSKVRENDISKCWPFDSSVETSTTADCEDDHEMLPPMDERLFRYWRCEGCSQKTGPVENIEHPAVLLRPSSSGKGTTGSPVAVSAAPMLMSKQKPSRLDDVEGISKDGAEKTTGPRTSISGETVRSKHHLNGEIPSLNGDFVVTESSPSNMQITCRADDSCYVDHEVAADDPTKNLDSMVIKDSVETCDIGKGNSRHDKHTGLIVRFKTLASGQVADACTREKGDHAGAQDTMEAGHDSSDNSEKNSVKNSRDLQATRGDHSSGPRRRKTRKIRLLTDLLCGNGGHGNANSSNTADTLPSINVVPYAPVEVDPEPPGPSNDPMETEGSSSAKKTLIPYKKRKFPRDDEWSAPESNPSSSKASKTRIPKKAVDHLPKKNKALASEDKLVIQSSTKGNSSKASGQNSAIMGKKVANSQAAFNSESVAGVRSKMVQQSSTKSNSSKSRVENSGVMAKKKDKNIVVADQHMSLAPPSRETFPTVTELSSGDNSCEAANATGHAAPKSVENLNAGREIDLFPLRAQEVDGNSCSVKNKQAKSGQFGENLSMLRQDLVAREAESNMETRSVYGQANQDLSSERGLNLSLDMYTTTHQPERLYNSVHDKQGSLFGKNVRMTSKDRVMRKDEQTQYAGMFSSSHGSPMPPPFGGVQSDVRRKQPMHGISFLGVAQSYGSQGDGGAFRMQKKDFGSASSNEKSMGIQEHVAAKRRDTDLRAGGRASKAPASDDIPMEIVELMAKNQYERCLPDARADSSRGHQTLDFGNRHIVDTHPFYQEALREKLLAQNARNGMIQWSENSRPPAKQKLVAQFPDQPQLLKNQAEQSRRQPLGYAEFLQRQNPSGMAQDAASSSGRQVGGQHLQWLRNLSSERPPVQSGSSNITGSWNEEANLSWPTMTPSHQLPFMFNDPKLLSSPSQPPSIIRKATPNMDNDPKFLNQNASSFHRQGSNSFGSETPRRRVSHLENPIARRSNNNLIELNQKPVGKSGIYSKETISAMHLLSLMDAGLRSNGQVNKEGRSTTRDRRHSEKRALPYDYGSENQFTIGFQQHGGPANPTRIGSSAPFQLDSGGFNKAIDFSSQVSEQNRHGSIPRNSGSGPVHIKNKILGSSDSSSRLPFQIQAASQPPSSMEHRLEPHSKTNTTNLPQKRTLELQETCRINRNPADFSYPGPGNPYMIGPKDLTFLDADRSEQKRQKKLTATRGRGKHRLNT